MRTPEEIYDLMKEEMPWGFVGEKQIKPYIIEALQIAQKEGHNNAIDLAAENAKAYNTVPRTYSDAQVDKDSILKLKTK